MIEKLKKIRNTPWSVALFLVLTSFLYDITLFLDNVSINLPLYSVILFFYFMFWLLLLYLGKGITAFFIIFNFVFFCIFKEYYKFHILPLNVFIFLDSFYEGASAGLKNIHHLFDKEFVFFCLLMIVQLYIVLKKSFFNLKKAYQCGIKIVLSFVLVFSWLVLFQKAHLLKYMINFFVNQQNIIYKADWILKYINKDTFKKVNNTFVLELKNIRKDMQKDEVFLSFLPKYIFLIQVESLTVNALENMPFLKSIIEKKYTNFYVDKNHISCGGSANTDFMMLSGMPLSCERLNGVSYNQYGLDMYKIIEPLPIILKKNGYDTFFFHNYEKSYFSRDKHIYHIGFNTVFFEEDFDKNIKRYSWGIDDIELLKKVSSYSYNDKKSFYFVVTVGMHPPYSTVPESFKTDIGNEKMRYMNAAKALDDGLNELYKSAQDDSLFIIYGDHNVPDLKFFDTPLILYYKGNNELTINGEKKEGFKGTIYFINSLFDERK